MLELLFYQGLPTPAPHLPDKGEGLPQDAGFSILFYFIF